MDPVDVLTMAVSAAQALRTAADPEAVLAGAYSVIGREAPQDQGESFALRVVRLLVESGEHRREVLNHLEEYARGPYFNRPPGGWGKEADSQTGPREPDPEAVGLLELVDSTEVQPQGRHMFEKGFGPFALATRSVPAYFGGRTIVERDGKRLTPEEAGEHQVGDVCRVENEGLPVTARGLIDHPLEVPILFTIETGGEPWSLWDICCAFADQYAKIYEHPQQYGVWGHDLHDLWIEGLLYYPGQRLIRPLVSS
jgi:hypothetical protein